MIGIMGSFHCIGMCGPIVLALPGEYSETQKYLLSRLLYNLGRTTTYGFMGGIMGTIGGIISLSGYQQPISIGLGVLILAGVILPTQLMQGIYPSAAFVGFSNKLKSTWGRLLKKNTYSGLYSIGVLNGFLPCGLVYMALAGSLSTGSILEGFVYMVLFGLGTIPMLLAVGFAGNFVGAKTRGLITRLFPYMAALIGVMFILRGLGLDIPYISPPANMGQPSTEMNCH
ncbi:sulfite exporter TauE/SafE family protein [bacterium]|nr:sulfite exporter TauE/SafE family protein [bacterium]